jgi:hypothetical protein
MPKTYEPIRATTVGTATSTVTFSSIPQTYTDLILVSNYATSVLNEDAYVQFNSDTGSNYSRTHIRGNGSSVFSSRASSQPFIPIDIDSSGTTLSTGLQTTTHIMNYSNSTTFKNTLCRSGTTGGSFTGTTLLVGLWRNTNAITTIDIKATGGNFVVGSTFTFYGVKSA